MMKTLLTGVALILFGALLGVLASRFLPMSPSVTPSQDIEPTTDTNPTEAEIETSPTVEITLPLTPTATPSSLLNLKWNMMTVKSPLAAFTSYRIYYPTTWSIKEYRNFSTSKDGGNSTLTLEKGTAILSIRQAPGEVQDCSPALYSDFHILIKRDIVAWKWAKKATDEAASTYDVCESLSGSKYISPTSIGYIIANSPTVVDAETLDEINYILEKIVILK
ncbi:hypothetical protein A3K29_01165 [Candidatus Collierbacteria bacterium RIFOXYB2_FULL_46_14]|nr:MAG: hypothetical protein A3K29_01165 [Candidatus Collierbacteria bacterium RIFOXYB2_FULL_46_14]OGD75783.1 MAG: hypothetical protein A3K43_01165 [Candidatus Collierbacteria bacterium RIFOXYA2_FULL_46_20]OGD77119.1 MAG: hypothetical protein A3K39_01165 [Candidatus Collierbacteria bacterium RIFOXYC2_FULL_43_15]OGD80409.1 MAG: hypothetical protein A2320_01655 [Pseudomonadales bacterium GWC2_63_15]OGD81841.1 MAG: hypothetical protein A3K36_01165 [Candidatus Collierbacteria bacterium RIFOXYD2_FUL